MLLIPAFRMLRQEDCCKFSAFRQKLLREHPEGTAEAGQRAEGADLLLGRSRVTQVPARSLAEANELVLLAPCTPTVPWLPLLQPLAIPKQDNRETVEVTCSCQHFLCQAWGNARSAKDGSHHLFCCPPRPSHCSKHFAGNST